MIFIKRYLGSALLLGSLSLIVVGCGTSSSTGSDGTGTTTTDTGATSTNALAVAFPDDLAISSITAATSAAASSSSVHALATKQAGEGQYFTPQRFEDKKEEMTDLMNPSQPRRIDTNLEKGAPPAECFGPTLNYSGTHPDTGTFQQGQLPGMDLGIWSEEEVTTGEACDAAVLNSMIAGIEKYTDIGLKVGAGILGEHAADNPTIATSTEILPDPGEVISMTSQAREIVPDGMDVSNAELTRRATDTTAGKPVFVLSFSGTIDFSGIDPDGAAIVSDTTIETTIEHHPEVQIESTTQALRMKNAVSEDETFSGVYYSKIGIPADGNCLMMGEQTFEVMTECISDEYQQVSSTEIRHHLKRAQFCGTPETVDCFTGNHVVDLTDDWDGNAFDIRCVQSPVDGSGRCSQAWQAGFNDGYTRVLNVTVASNGTGCGYFGFGGNMSTSTTVGIDGMICNWTGPGSGPFGNKVVSEKAQRQCFTRNATTGIFESVSSNLAITYAPTNSCDKAANSFAYGLQDPPTDVPASQAVSDNLIDVTDVDFIAVPLPVVSE